MSAWRASVSTILHAGVEERQLAQAMLQRREVELGACVNVSVLGRNVTSVPRLPLAVADHLERRFGDAVAELDEVLLAVAPDAAARSQVDSALTTDTPTPCRPPETL